MRFNDSNAATAHRHDMKLDRRAADFQMLADRDRDPEFDLARSMARVGHEGQAVSEWKREGVNDHPTAKPAPIPAIRWIPGTRVRAENAMQPVLL